VHSPPENSSPVLHIYKPGGGPDFEHQLALCGALLTSTYLRALVDSKLGIPLCRECREIARLALDTPEPAPPPRR
jgi:hypothetical protein